MGATTAQSMQKTASAASLPSGAKTLAAVASQAAQLLQQQQQQQQLLQQSMASAVGSSISHAGVSVEHIHVDKALLQTIPIHAVQLDALVVMKIIKHCRELAPTPVTGQLLGIDVQGSLQVTNCFPFTVVSSGDADDAFSASAPLEPDDAKYQLTMLKCLRQLNYDVQTVGWYKSADLGSFWSQSFIDTQFQYQQSFAQSVVIVYDTSRSSQGNLSLKAMRLTNTFMDLYRQKRFTMESLVKNKLTPSSVVEYLPVKIHNSHLLTAMLHQMEESAAYPSLSMRLSQPTSSFKSPIPTVSTPFTPNFDNLDLGGDGRLEKNLEYLGEAVDDHGQEQWRWQGWSRNYAKEQARIAQQVARKRADNATRAAGGQPLIHTEDEIMVLQQSLNKIAANEPSRLETLVLTNQVDVYSKQMSEYGAAQLSKMFLVKALAK
ncbi:hypothetical protein SeMB42_g05351 [Synchytrium endobioticum]|uniref:Eukaryotic translation initiation factor 3 subunit H n=1 Tax=Synchytrium endobioticum TaxID=286115 RepID=A0A507CS14_9FUNG|nr:hypothetical protein SeMB42_g05351 [Synchytrium endobioticum]TPX50479.1 hypothetical protein SeLEV6574_g00886 [Synchytrium endobioticum]